MPFLVVVRPGRAPKMTSVFGALRLEDLHKLVGVRELDARMLGTIPPRGTRVHMWIDDFGLSRPEAVPNRRLPNGHEVSGVIVLCAVVGEDDVGFDQEEAAWLVEDVETRWEKLAPGRSKPEPRFEVRTFPTTREALDALGELVADEFDALGADVADQLRKRS